MTSGSTSWGGPRPGPRRCWTSSAASCRGRRPQPPQQLLLVEGCLDLVFFLSHALRHPQQQPQQQHQPPQQQLLLLAADCWGLVYLPNHARKLPPPQQQQQQQPQQLRRQQQLRQQHVEDSWEAVSCVNIVLSKLKNFNKS